MLSFVFQTLAMVLAIKYNATRFVKIFLKGSIAGEEDFYGGIAPYDVADDGLRRRRRAS